MTTSDDAIGRTRCTMQTPDGDEIATACRQCASEYVDQLEKIDSSSSQFPPCPQPARSARLRTCACRSTRRPGSRSIRAMLQARRERRSERAEPSGALDTDTLSSAVPTVPTPLPLPSAAFDETLSSPSSSYALPYPFSAGGGSESSASVGI